MSSNEKEVEKGLFISYGCRTHNVRQMRHTDEANNETPQLGVLEEDDEFEEFPVQGEVLPSGELI